MCTHCVYKKTDDVLLLKSGCLWAMTKINMIYLFLTIFKFTKRKCPEKISDMETICSGLRSPTAK